MPTSYPITGIVYDTDGSTLMTSGNCKLFDVTTGESISTNIASDGSFSIDLANLTSYSNEDKLQVVLYDSTKTKSTEFRHTVNTGLSGYDAGSLYMHWTVPILGDSTLMGLVISNKSDSAEYTVDFYDRKYDNKLLSCDVNVNSSFSPTLWFKGIYFEGGICVIRESDAANTVEVQMVVK